MKKNDRMYAKTALRKNQISKHRSLGSSRFVPEGETSPGLKRAMVILPLLIITVLIVIVVVDMILGIVVIPIGEVIGKE